ncbi:MAG TPA: potassium channel family protein [Acidimicrobiales bacterium]
MDRFLDEAPTVRNAMAVILLATVVTTVAGGFIVWLFDPHDFTDLGLAMWWALQTVTTVGYGDVVPTNGFGRVVGAVVMLESIAFISIVTAAITSIFVARARRERTGNIEAPEMDETRAALASLAEQLTRLEATVQELHRAVTDGPITPH